MSKLTGIQQIELEMSYTTWEQSCKDPAVDPSTGDLRECRRQHSHTGPHASGFGPGLYMWGRAA